MGQNLTIDQCILERRSIRSFLTDKVPRETVEALISLGSWAPSGSNIQACRYIAIDDEALINQIKMYSPGLNGHPPCLIVLCSDMARVEAKNGGKLAMGDMACFDVAMAAENIMLAAVGKGLGSCAIRSFEASLVSHILRLPKALRPQLMLSLGYPDKTPPAPKRLELSEILSYNIKEA